MHRPPLVVSWSRMSSGTLRGWSTRPRALECENITGFVVVSIAAAIVVATGDERALYVIGAIPLLGLLWGVFNTFELIFRIRLET